MITLISSWLSLLESLWTVVLLVYFPSECGTSSCQGDCVFLCLDCLSPNCGSVTSLHVIFFFLFSPIFFFFYFSCGKNTWHILDHRNHSFFLICLSVALGFCCCVRAFLLPRVGAALWYHTGLSPWPLSLQSIALGAEHGSRCVGSVVVAHGLQLPVAYIGSSRTRDRAHVPSVGRQIPIHCTTREVLSHS